MNLWHCLLKSQVFFSRHLFESFHTTGYGKNTTPTLIAPYCYSVCWQKSYRFFEKELINHYFFVTVSLSFKKTDCLFPVFNFRIPVCEGYCIVGDENNKCLLKKKLTDWKYSDELRLMQDLLPHGWHGWMNWTFLQAHHVRPPQKFELKSWSSQNSGTCL